MTVKDWLGENNQLGQDIWQRKYRHNNESFEEWLDRVSAGDNELRKLIIEKKFLMGGRTLANRGLNNTGSLFNCYSRGYIEDDYYDIMDAAKDIGITFKAQGGQGISLTKLRPKGTPIKTEYYSDGIVPFMKIFNEVTAGTSQGGARKGALMLSIDARHKEAETFIKIKSKEGEIEKANLSLELDDEFMRAVEKYYDTGEVVTLHEKRNYSGHEIEYDVTPIEIFKMLVDNCYDWADPACLFTNKFRNYNLMQFDEDYEIETCNPCGEQPLPKHGACCLSSLNLSEFIVNPYTPQAHLNTADLLSAIDVGIRTLDKLIDENYNRHPLQQQRDMSYNYRNIGLGIFGYATALMKLGFRYGSPEAIEFTDDVFSLIFRRAVLASNELAKELGPYPKYKEEIFDSDIIKFHFSPDEITKLKEYGLRNCSLVSIAPTGSLATLLGESGGCEPEFALKYTRRTVGMTDGKDTYYDVYCKAAREYMEINNTKELPDYFVGSADISWQSRVLTQAVMQKHVDTAISSTVNMPNSATKDDIAHMYLLAWSSGCKGITMFRDGCKRLGILTTGNKKEEEISHKGLKRGEIMKCADDLIGKKRKIINGCGSTHVLGFFEPVYGDLVEVFFTKGSLGGCSNYMVGLSRMVSLACRAGVSINDIQDQLNSTGACPSYAIRTATKHDTSKGACCPMAIGNALMDMWKEVQEELGYLEEPKKKKIQIGELCPECGAILEHSGGCDICKECGYSHCN
jgi:ribonucleoside-diphosphate reductase alpha chain